MDDYRQQWKQYRRRYVYFVAIFVLFVPAVMGLAILSSKVFHADAAVPYIAGFWMALWVFSGLRVNAWPCPRCRKCFIGYWWFGNPLMNAAVRRCAHCELPRPEGLLSVFPPRV